MTERTLADALAHAEEARKFKEVGSTVKDYNYASDGTDLVLLADELLRLRATTNFFKVLAELRHDNQMNAAEIECLRSENEQLEDELDRYKDLCA